MSLGLFEEVVSDTGKDLETLDVTEDDEERPRGPDGVETCTTKEKTVEVKGRGSRTRRDLKRSGSRRQT